MTPAFAANGTSNSEVYKEETVYVNAKASGKTDKVTVSNWLKNSGSVSGDLEDESTLSDIKNVKGDEKYTSDGDKLTWATDGEDIYYQGTTDKKLPVSVKLKYYLDGKEMKPSELKGKSGHLKITVDYKNNEKKNVSVDGKDTEVCTPFVMMTGMILPNETFSNVTIDNGKIISDGNKNIVVGFGMPGLKDSLNLSSEESDKVTIPESLSIEADVTDFTMSRISTYLSFGVNPGLYSITSAFAPATGSFFCITPGRTVAICGRWLGQAIVAIVLPPNAGRVINN